VFQLLFPVRVILLARGHYARLTDGPSAVNDASADWRHRSFIRSDQRDEDVMLVKMFVGRGAGKQATVSDFHPRPGQKLREDVWRPGLDKVRFERPFRCRHYSLLLFDLYFLSKIRIKMTV